jgi:hypothetical protein
MKGHTNPMALPTIQQPGVDQAACGLTHCQAPGRLTFWLIPIFFLLAIAFPFSAGADLRSEYNVRHPVRKLVYYSIEIGSFHVAEQAVADSICQSFKDKGHLSYLSVADQMDGEPTVIGVRIGLYETSDQARDDSVALDVAGYHGTIVKQCPSPVRWTH